MRAPVAKTKQKPGVVTHSLEAEEGGLLESEVYIVSFRPAKGCLVRLCLKKEGRGRQGERGRHPDVPYAF